VGLLLDIDGTLLDAGRAIAGAAEAVATLRGRGVPLVFATNTSRKSRRAVGDSLRAAGISARDDEVLSASYAAAIYLRSAGTKRVQLLLPPEACNDFDGMERADEKPEAVVVGDMGSGFDFDILNSAFRNLHAGARLIAVHKNRFWKSETGWTIDAGAFVAALEYAADTRAEVVGKPSILFFRMAAKLLGISIDRLSIVGDDLESDIAGGRACGLTTFLVKTGKFDAAKLAEAAPEHSPHYVIESVASLPGTYTGSG
jgi:HAD superfamily hydrolase (TIGR01458 family)